MPKFILKGSRATIIVTADNEFSAGAQAANFNIGVVHSITQEIKRGRKGHPKQPGDKAAKRTPRENVSVVPFQFPLELQS